MGPLEFSGKTVEEAIEIAENELGVSRDELKITVLKESRAGILGLGFGEARIRVEIISDELKAESQGSQDAAQIAQNILQTLLEKLDIKASITRVKSEIPDDNEEKAPTIAFDISGEDDVGILIGRHGQTLASLQYLLRIMVAQKTLTWVPVIVDVDGYKKRRNESLQATAARLAEQVVTRKMPFTLEPMPAYERRIIHLALANHPLVTTKSIGEGDARKVVIMPRTQNKPKY